MPRRARLCHLRPGSPRLVSPCLQLQDIAETVHGFVQLGSFCAPAQLEGRQVVVPVEHEVGAAVAEAAHVQDGGAREVAVAKEGDTVPRKVLRGRAERVDAALVLAPEAYLFGLCRGAHGTEVVQQAVLELRQLEKADERRGVVVVLAKVGDEHEVAHMSLGLGLCKRFRPVMAVIALTRWHPS
jgi:hypothetical protein